MRGFQKLASYKDQIRLIIPLCILSCQVYAQHEVCAVRVINPPQIDGRVDEEVWSLSSQIVDFYQREPVTDAPSSERTEVFILYDEKNLYVGFRCYQDPGTIVAKEMARDVSLGNDDRVQVILDTYLDRRNAFWFQVGPRGSIGDAIVSENGAAFNKAWDGLWTGKARIHDNGWDAEFAIPFKTLSFREGQTIWGLKLIRYIKKNEETVYWPVANLNTYRFQVSDAGSLTGIEDITQGIGLDIVPYGLAGVSNKQDNEKKLFATAGLDAYYQVTSGIKAAATINTDFAQTEVDNRQINLTRFSLLYPEKRDFFLDGANYFNFGINGDQDNSYNSRLIPFFSRSIGLDSLGNPIPVQYGGKITGQAGNWNLGAMYMKDDRDGWKNSHFGVTRITRNFGEQSQAGLIATYGNTLTDVSNYLLGMDVKLATASFRGDKNLAFTTYGLKSFTHDMHGKDLSYGAEVVYPNDFLSFRAGHMQIQENFIAGTGFVPRPGVKETYLQVFLGPRPDRWGILQVLSGGKIDYITGFNNRLLTRELSLTPLQIRFKSGDMAAYMLSYQHERLEKDFNIYKDYVIPEGSYDFRWHYIDIITAKRRRVWATSGFGFGGFYNGKRQENTFELGCQVDVPLFISTTAIRNLISLPEGEFTTYIYRFNLNVLFSPDITLYNFIQYDSKSGNLGWQSRFRWILKPGRELFFVWNSITYDPRESIIPDEVDCRVKLKYAIRF